jgi:hypothetical protein
MKSDSFDGGGTFGTILSVDRLHVHYRILVKALLQRFFWRDLVVRTRLINDFRV